ncbi:MAG: PLxRFG domain-containing protein, partial [Alicycliphilus sp.]|nr:PLxRFG domain-containing protein [Alicycliphilus sp.]
LNKTFNAPGKLSWWWKSVGTMYGLAERSPAFKPVFNAAQGFVDDVSHYATDAAELAPKLLPKLETWRDIAKRPITAADNAAVAKPVFEGTLDWARDESGKPVRLQTLMDAAEKLTPAQKAQRLLRQNKISEGMLKAWQGLPLEQYEKLVASRYESQMLQAGIVWTPAELKAQFKLNDAQVELYQEFRAATNRSLDTMARSDMLRFGGEDVKDLADMVMDAKDAQDAAQILRDHLQMLAKEDPDRAGAIGQLANGMLDRAARVQELQEQGYAPLSRFGKYTVDVVNADGKREYFGLFETAREANIMAMKMRKGFGQDAVTQGTLSDEEFKLLAGITPESLELFGNMLGLDATGDDAQDQAFQEYLRRTKTNRSAMRRLIHRQGIAGYSEDVGRVLASFIYSNSRQTSAGLHMGDLGQAITAIPKQQGELKDAAIQMAEYVKNPREEAQMVRGLLFAQYLGGSIASAMVNMSQPAAVTFPWLSQFGGAKQAAAELGRAAKNLASRGHRFEADLAAALKHAEEEGTVSPQEVHQLQAQAQGSGSLRPGDGTRAGAARAAAGNALTRLSLAWGKVFGAAEQVNRRMTFIAAYRVAKAQKMANPAAFAKKAVIETQFTYSKANKMKWGRGAVGATAMTFKTYSIAYLELLGRMWTQGEPGSQERKDGRKAVLLALGMLMLMGGAGGLPFAEDAEDLADGLAQMMGYNINSKKAKQELLENIFGEAGAGFVERGITGLPGMPLDVSGRLGMGNLLPATGLFKEKTDHTRDVLEIVGPVGDLAKRAVSGARSVLTGDVGAGLLQMAPAAVRNAAKGADMAATGMYRDDKGYKVLDTSPTEAAMKAIGFQPASVSKVQESNFINQQAKNFYNMQAQEIRAKWARGIFEKNTELVAEARTDLEDWNRKNPDQRIVVSMPAVLKRVREMGKSKDERIAATAPKAMRQQMREDAAKARAAL